MRNVHSGIKGNVAFKSSYLYEIQVRAFESNISLTVEVHNVKSTRDLEINVGL